MGHLVDCVCRNFPTMLIEKLLQPYSDSVLLSIPSPFFINWTLYAPKIYIGVSVDYYGFFPLDTEHDACTSLLFDDKSADNYHCCLQMKMTSAYVHHQTAKCTFPNLNRCLCTQWGGVNGDNKLAQHVVTYITASDFALCGILYHLSLKTKSIKFLV